MGNGILRFAHHPTCVMAGIDDEIVAASTRRIELVERLRCMLDASVPVPPETPSTPTKDLGFSKGFPVVPRWQGQPADVEVWESLYKTLWRPGDGEDYSWVPESDGDDQHGTGDRKYEIVLDNNRDGDGPFNWHETGLTRVFAGEFAESIEWFTKIELYDGAHPLDRARAVFNKGVLYGHTDGKNGRVPNAIHEFHKAHELLTTKAGTERGWASDPIVADAESRENVLTQERDATWRTNADAAKALELEAEALAVAKQWDNAIEAWGKCETAWGFAGDARDGTFGHGTEDAFGTDVEARIADARAKAGDAAAERDKPQIKGKPVKGKKK